MDPLFLALAVSLKFLTPPFLLPSLPQVVIALGPTWMTGLQQQ